VNVPVGIATAVVGHRLLHRDRGVGFGGGADVAGAALITSALMLMVYTIVKPAAEDGWTSWQTLAFGAVSVGLLVGFFVRQARARNPLLPLRIFRSRVVIGSNAIQALTTAGMFGLAFLPCTIVMGTLSVRYAERLITRFGARRTLLAGLVIVAAGLALFTRVPVDGNYVRDILPVALILGVGIGVAFPALMTVSMSEATPADAGLTSGLVNTSAEVGGALGLAVLATVSATRTRGLVAGGHDLASALTQGYRVAFVVGALLVMAAIVVAVRMLGTREPAVADVVPIEAEPVAEDAAAC
jgi:Major Facilitator Superfamily